jgi:hypothetical protein
MRSRGPSDDLPGENEILGRCSERFDDRRYCQATDFVPQRALRAFFETGEWPEEEAERLAIFGALRRRLARWGTRDRRDDGLWYAYRALFLATCTDEVSEPYRVTEAAVRWETQYVPRLDDLIARIRWVHEHTAYRDGALPPI